MGPRVQIRKSENIRTGGISGCVQINDSLTIANAERFYFTKNSSSSGAYVVAYDSRFSPFQQLFYHQQKMVQYFLQQWYHIKNPTQSQSSINPQPQQTNNKSSSDSNPICYLLYFILIFPFMLILILISGVLDGLLFIITLGLCFGKCKDKKRTWCSYAIVRSATNWSSQMVTEICQFLSGCQCCCIMALFTLPIGLSFVIIGFAFDLVAWCVTLFYCFGYCCKNNQIMQYSLGRKAWRNLKWCCYQLLKCEKII